MGALAPDRPAAQMSGVSDGNYSLCYCSLNRAEGKLMTSFGRSSQVV